MAQGAEFPLRKPPGFHYDFFLLGITTSIAGLLGVPAPNGLIPQAPIHTTSLLVMGSPQKCDLEDAPFQRPYPESTGDERQLDSSFSQGLRSRSQQSDPFPSPLEPQLEPDPAEVHGVGAEVKRPEFPIAVVEQRVSNLAQGALCLVLLTGPFLHVLNLIPRGVLAGLL